MTDYEKIKAMCLAKGELWEDPDFPAVQTSVFYYQRPPFHFFWKRPKELYQNPVFMSDIDTFDVTQGKLGDKWLVSCLGVLFLSKGLFHKVVPTDQRVDREYAGIFRFRLWWCGQWTEVLVDDRLPTVDERLAFLQSSQTGQLWPALLEKAYAKLHGSYEALKYGNLLDGLADLTGGITESISEKVDVGTLANLLRHNSLVTAYYSPGPAEEPLVGLHSEMNYRIYRVDKIRTTEGIMYLVLIKRPLTPGGRQTGTTLDVTTWKLITPYERERLLSDGRGTWMPFTDFQRLFSRLEIVHLDPDTSKLEFTDKEAWHVRMFQGNWRRGVSAGGCRNNANFFHINPQVQLILHQPGTVLVSLNQHSIMEPKVIGFSIYKMPAFLQETANHTFFKGTKSTINSQYTNSRQVSHRCELDSGAYLIIPTTFEPREEADFSLRVFSSNCVIDMMVLDCTPQILKTALKKAPAGLDATSFAQYESVFLQLADERRTINAFELQELLDACLPNDYIKSCASLDTCRQIVLSLDETGSGRISLENYKDLMCSLKYWQMIFKNHAREKMGVLRAERLRDALHEVGFVVPEQVLALLVLRFMRKDGMLRYILRKRRRLRRNHKFKFH
ncbi:calpain-C isoform X2 [Amyelois transitella]|uniref:calpain-C isoform X2 n=1 Tax=Amyelois transitella TaxID=680683 RepID=UPI00298F4220|nr:calpain-C isoform X2 [Amyelois transitella]